MPLTRNTDSNTRIVSTTALRTTAILTNSYVNSSSVAVAEGQNQLILLLVATMGSLTSIEIKVEFSDNGTTWYQETFGAISLGTDTLTLGEHTLVATGNYRIPISILDRFFRIAVKGTGTVTSSDILVDGVLGIA